jgi:hypothetical protein
MNVRTVTFALWLGISTSAVQAGQREIEVNGEKLNEFGLALLDIVNCGSPVPNGRYWIDWTRRTWGYQGTRTAAPLPDCAQPRAAAMVPGQRAGSWEDRMHEGLCARGGRCDVDIVINPVYR